jgi:hypothetical protein
MLEKTTITSSEPFGLPSVHVRRDRDGDITLLQDESSFPSDRQDEVILSQTMAAQLVAFLAPQPAAPAPAKRAAPKGAQQYRGNGNHEWETVTTRSGTDRLRVPGGWLYRFNNTTLAFVPVPDAVGYAV